MADVSERLSGKDMHEVTKERLQTSLAGLQALAGVGALIGTATSENQAKLFSDGMVLLYTGLTAYAHFAYDDKKAGLPPAELVALRELKTQITETLGVDESEIRTRLADLVERHNNLKAGLRTSLAVGDGYESDNLVSEVSNRQAEILRLQNQQRDIRSLLGGASDSALNTNIVTEVRSTLVAKDAVISSKDEVIRSKDVTIAAERQTNRDIRLDMSEQEERFGRENRELTGRLTEAETARDKYQRNNVLLEERLEQEKTLSSIKDVTISNQEQQIQSQLLEIESLRLQLRQTMQQRSNNSSSERDFEDEVVEAVQGLGDDAKEISSSSQSKLAARSNNQNKGIGGV